MINVSMTFNTHTVLQDKKGHLFKMQIPWRDSETSELAAWGQGPCTCVCHIILDGDYAQLSWKPNATLYLQSTIRCSCGLHSSPGGATGFFVCTDCLGMATVLQGGLIWAPTSSCIWSLHTVRLVLVLWINPRPFLLSQVEFAVYQWQLKESGLLQDQTCSNTGSPIMSCDHPEICNM